jgi:hypothetical protein
MLRGGIGEQNKEGPGRGLPRHIRGRCVGIGTGKAPNSEDEDVDEDDASEWSARMHRIAMGELAKR